MKIPTLSLKPFAAWATDLTNKYRFNPFFQATVHIIGLQVILAILLIGISGWAIQYAQTNTVTSISHHISQAEHGMPAATSLPAAIDDVRSRTLTYVFVGLVLLIALFGLLLIQFALSPAKNSLQFQKRFIGNVAHEIRTPLAIIKTSSEVALMDPHLQPEYRETFESTITELDRISETINNLLSFDLLMRPEQMKKAPVDLGILAQTVLERHQALADSRNITLAIDIRDSQHCTIIGNAVALEQVLTNLTKNALNYTPANSGGKVTLVVEPEFADRVAFTVRDTGIGIAQKDLIHIFEPFYRGDKSRARNIGTGTSGLGLAIVNEIVRLHHGTINVRSVLTEGTSIKISFPRADARRLSKAASPQLADDPEENVQEISLDFS
jgi:signal transduction histidine kinase